MAVGGAEVAETVAVAVDAAVGDVAAVGVAASVAATAGALVGVGKAAPVGVALGLRGVEVGGVVAPAWAPQPASVTAASKALHRKI